MVSRDPFEPKCSNGTDCPLDISSLGLAQGDGSSTLHALARRRNNVESPQGGARSKKPKGGDDPVKVISALPLLPLRDLVIFPGTTVLQFVGRPKCVEAVQVAIHTPNKLVVAIPQKRPETYTPTAADLLSTGTVTRISELIELRDGTIRILMEGLHRVRIEGIQENRGVQIAKCSPYPESDLTQFASPGTTTEGYALLREIWQNGLNRTSPLVRFLGTESYQKLLQLQPRPAAFCDRLASELRERGEVNASTAVELLCEPELTKRIKILHSTVQKLISELPPAAIEEGPKKGRRVTQDSQPRTADPDENDYSLEDRVKKRESEFPSVVRRRIAHEMSRLEQMQDTSPEATVIRNWVEHLLRVPFSKTSGRGVDLNRAKATLDRDHYGLVDVKDLILQHLAVLKLTTRPQNTVLCLLGPPGIGKTSLGKSVAEALGRKFVRISLGGLRDEAEIRGHRRTYIGAEPGKIVRALQKAGENDPVILLDEIGKISADYRGDPAAALLEVLDPEQNRTFDDHYLGNGCELDLSRVFFICTANDISGLPPALRDRLEIIRLPGYTTTEKLAIAKDYLVPKQMRNCGLTMECVEFSDEALRAIIDNYTREAGVRGLERQVRKVLRKLAWAKVERGSLGSIEIGLASLEEYLGPARYPATDRNRCDRVGEVTGLAVTDSGGVILPIQVDARPGRGILYRTGNLKAVMRESTELARTWVINNGESFGIKGSIDRAIDISCHFPDAATPKDGPSAGIGIATAMVSRLTNRPVRADVALTGEIDLFGNVLAIGGVSDKIGAAVRAGKKEVIIPAANGPELRLLPTELLSEIKVTLVSTMDEVLRAALTDGAPDKRAVEPELRPARRSPRERSNQPRWNNGNGLGQ